MAGKSTGKLLILAAIVLLAMAIYSMSPKKRNRAVQSLSQLLNHRIVVEGDSIKFEEPVKNKAEAEPISEADDNGETRKSLEKLWKKISKISMFDNKKLQAYRGIGEKWVSYDPQEFEDFMVEQIGDIRNSSTEPAFFFIESYITYHRSPGQGVSRILNLDTKAGGEKDSQGLSARQKLNMAKAFALEALFERLESGGDFAIDPLPQVEVDLVKIVRTDKNLNLVREAMMALSRHYQYSKVQLGSLVEKRPSNERYAFKDLIE